MNFKILFYLVFFSFFFFQKSENYYSYFDEIRKEEFKQPKGSRFIVYLISDNYSEERVKKLFKTSDDILGLVDSSNFKAFKAKLEKIHPDVKWVEFRDESKKKEFQNKFNYQSAPILLIAHDGLVSFDPSQTY
ncbi:hypothetical protein [Cecembia calidifontis]|jgi:hypothetical protein|uniref:Uncharacterized protein n=1 Tax=Cecembia calidifontis TaxID=1187080 RepID=A0A4Q7P502_9BACT|nr:hypothetical protein [Cecembia calidifontis]RZS94540.1 hypothetical protein BC751_0038 [Cecembia calidifontis]